MKDYIILYLCKETNFEWERMEGFYEKDEAFKTARKWKEENPSTSSVMICRVVADDSLLGGI